MENFTYGIAGASYLLGDFIFTILQFKLLWGFVIGFGVAMLVQAFLATAGSARNGVSTQVSASVVSSMHVAPRATLMSKLSILTRVFFSLAMLLFLVFAIISTVRV